MLKHPIVNGLKTEGVQLCTPFNRKRTYGCFQIPIKDFF